MRDLKTLQSWEEFEANMLKNPKVRKAIEESQTEYQIARSLIELRLKCKMSQAQLAHKIGTKQPVISRIEGMNSHPTISLLKRISHALNCDLHISFRAK